jgi:immune inhibitor A
MDLSSNQPVSVPPAQPSSNRGVIIGIVLVSLCICATLVALGAFVMRIASNSGGILNSVNTLVPPVNLGSPTPAVSVTRVPVGSVSSESLTTLENTSVPGNDLYDLACRLRQDACGIAHTVPAPATPYKVGDRKQFWVSNEDTVTNFQVNTTLRYITPHTYFWVEDGTDAKDADIKALMDTFETKIYPTDRQFFGSEWTPGVDNDPHIYVLYVRGVGQSVGGYFSSQDEYNPNPKIYPYSNGHELFIFNSDGESLTDPYTYGTLAHEFQHMIRWHLNHTQPDWLNEGLSELATFLNGYANGGADASYATNPDIPLTDWTSLSTDPNITGEHYGMSFLFVTYYLDRFGPQATQTLAEDPLNGLNGVDDALKKANITDKQTGKPISADDFFVDWAAALYLKDGSVGDGRFTYHNYPDVPQTQDTHTITDCPQSPLNLSVNQYGIEYIDISCSGSHSLSFQGSTAAKILPADPHSGKYVFWSNLGDESDMTLTHSFDLTGVSAPIQLSYWTWYDLEKGYDYAYLEVSTDGQHWDIIHTPSCSDKDTSGNAYGCGYTGMSGGGDAAQWINETADLSAYAGKQVQVRFEYVTDPELNGEGLLLDDVSLAAAHYSTDFEADDGGWQAQGFARIQNTLPQTYRLALITKGATTTVQYIPVNADETADIPLALQDGQHAVLVVTGTQRFTNLPTGFTVEVK